jgi:maltose O-acetyltransferase
MISFFFKVISRLLKQIPKIKAIYYTRSFGSCGTGLQVFGSPHLQNIENIVFGDNCSINDGAYLNGLGGITIGNDVSISALSIIVSTGLSRHTFLKTKSHFTKRIVIGNNVQVGAGAIVLPGVCIGDNVIVGAGSVVTKNVAARTVVAGNPAKVLGSIS